MTRLLKQSNTFLLRLPLSIKEDAVRCSRIDGTSLNHFISLAVAEKITRLEIAAQAPTELPVQRAKLGSTGSLLLRRTS